MPLNLEEETNDGFNIREQIPSASELSLLSLSFPRVSRDSLSKDI